MKKLLMIAAAALTASTIGAGAVAQPYRDRVVTRTTVVDHRGPGYRHHVARRKVCRVTWYNHRKVRRCFWR